MKEKITYNETYHMGALMEYLDSKESVAVVNHIKETLSLEEMIDLMLVGKGVITEEREEPDYLESQPNKEITNLIRKHSLLQRLADRKPTP